MSWTSTPEQARKVSHYDTSREQEFRGGKLVSTTMRAKPVFVDEIPAAQPVCAGLNVGGVPVFMGDDDRAVTCGDASSNDSK